MRTFLFPLLILLALPLSGSAQAEPELQIADLVPFTLHDDPQAKLSLLAHANTALVGLRATVKELKDPDGHSLPPTLLEATVESAQIGDQGTRIHLRPDLSGFRRPGDYLAVLLLSATTPMVTPIAAPRPGVGQPVNRLITLTLRRERPNLYAEPLHVRLVRRTPWQPAKLSVPYSIENRSPRALHELSLNAQPLALATRNEGRDAPRDFGSSLLGSMTMVLPPPPLGQSLQRQRTGQSIDLPANGRLDFTLLFSDFPTVGRFRSGLSLSAPDLDGPQILPISVEVSDRWEFALLAITLGVLFSAIINQLSRRYRKAAENHYRIAQLALEVEGLRSTGSSGSARRASFSEKLRRAALRNSDGEATLAANLLEEIDAELTTFYGTQNELRASVHDRLEKVQTQARQLVGHRASLNPDQGARLRQIRLELERITAFVATEQLEAADLHLRVTQDQVQSLARALTAPDPNAPTLHAETPTLLGESGLRIDVQEPASRWWTGRAVRLRAVDERRDKNPADLPVYIWRLGDHPAEPGATDVEFPLDKPGIVELQLIVRRADGTDAAQTRRALHVMAPRPTIDLDAAPGPRLRVQYVLTLIAFVLASLSGVYLLCFGTALQPLFGASFGTPAHYIAAIAWGIAVDMLLRGFSDMLVRLSADR